MSKLSMRVCLAQKKVCLSRAVVRALGNPTHLYFWYDELEENLMISSAEADDLDAYEIPRFFWSSTKHSCEIWRIAFLTALHYRIGWEDGSQYAFEGFFLDAENVPMVLFHLTNGTRVR